MDTVTEEPTRPAQLHLPAREDEVEPIDPEHDIDAKKTAVWLGGALVFVIVSMWALAEVFSFSMSGQQHEKIDLAPTDELRAIRSDDDHWLRNQQPIGPADQRSLDEIEQSIDASTAKIIEAYLRK